MVVGGTVNGHSYLNMASLGISVSAAKRLTIKVLVRKGVPWSDGFGVTTTEDVKYSFERIAGITDLQADYVVDWQSLKKVEIIDEVNCVIHLKEPFAALWNSSLPCGSSEIVCKAAIEALPKDTMLVTFSPNV